MLKKRILCAIMCIFMLSGTFLLTACTVKKVYENIEKNPSNIQKEPVRLTHTSVSTQDVSSVASILESVSLGTVEGPQYCGDGTYMYRIQDMTLSNYHDYCRKFKNENGYTESNIRKWEDASETQFRTYTKGNICVELNFYDKSTQKNSAEAAPSEEIRCIVSGENYYTAYPQYFTEGTYSGTAQPLFTQLALNYTSKNNGLSYLVRTQENTFIVIDGGYAGQGEAAHIYATMCEQSGSDRPTIAAWILTHPHGDHIGAIADFIKLYGSTVVPEAVIFNFQDKAALDTYDDYATDNYDTIYAALADGGVWSTSTFIKPHTGEILYIDGVKMNVLFTIEDCYGFSSPISYSNGNTMVFSLEAEGKKIMVTSDTYGYLTDAMTEWYGAEFMKSDIMTVIHHGRTNGSTSTYQNINPTIAVWPTSYESYFVDEKDGVIYRDMDYNQWLTANVPHNLFCYEGDYIIKLSDLSYELKERNIGQEWIPIADFNGFKAIASGYKYYLVNDITIPSSETSAFILPAKNTYVIDGRGYTLSIEGNTAFEASSLLSNTPQDGTVIKNLKIGTSTTSITLTGSTNMGVLFGTVSGETIIENVHVYANIDDAKRDTDTKQNNQVGGFVGKVTGNLTIINSSFEGTLKTNKQNEKKYFGGFVGSVEEGSATIINSTATFDASTVKSPSHLGNLIGNINTSAIIASCNSTTPVGKGAANAEIFSLSMHAVEPRTNQPSGIRFITKTSLSGFEALLTRFGADNVRVGTIITPSAYVERASGFTKQKLDKLSVTSIKYLDLVYASSDTAQFEISGDDMYFAGSIVNIFESHKSLKYSAVGYIELTVNGQTLTVYAPYDSTLDTSLSSLSAS